MARQRLDARLLEKIAGKTLKPRQYVREQISKRAARLGISSEAAQILWAKQLNIGTVRFQSSLQPHMQEEVRTGLPMIFARAAPSRSPTDQKASRTRPRGKSPLQLAIDFLITDEELRSRCSDLLRARGNFDRVFREATTVLEHRVKKLSGITQRMKPGDLVGKALNPDPDTALLRISAEKYEQQGFFNICSGLFLAFRDTTHHELSDKFSREDALRFCGFVNALLGVLQQAKRNPNIAC